MHEDALAGALDADEVAADHIDPDAPVAAKPHNLQWDVLLAIGVGGVLGAEARYGLGQLVPHARGGFPWSTLVINASGSFCIAVLMVVLAELTSPHRLWRPFIGVGILGGYTTFSTFTVDIERLVQERQLPTAGLYLMATVLGCAAAVAVGDSISRAALSRAAAHRRQHRNGGQR